MDEDVSLEESFSCEGSLRILRRLKEDDEDEEGMPSSKSPLVSSLEEITLPSIIFLPILGSSVIKNSRRRLPLGGCNI
jgi:hypothetical protein